MNHKSPKTSDCCPVHSKRGYLISASSLPQLPTVTPGQSSAIHSWPGVGSSPWKQTVRAVGLIICSNLRGEDELAQHQVKAAENRFSSITNCELLGLTRRERKRSSSSSQFSKWHRAVKKGTDDENRVIDVVWALRSNAQCHSLSICVSQQKSDSREKTEQSTQQRPFFYARLIPRAPDCWKDCVCATSPPHHSLEEYLADMLGVKPSHQTRGLRFYWEV